MSLDLRDIERGVGADLLRRPLVAHVLNAAVLRLYSDFSASLDEDECEREPGDPAPAGWLRPALAVAVCAFSYVVLLAGLAEAVVWVVLAAAFKVVRAPRIYAFEKLLLDVRVLFARHSVRHVKKTVRLQSPAGGGLQRLSARREGIGSFVITTIYCDETMTRDTRALLRLCRYMNKMTISFWRDDHVVMVGPNRDLVDAVCSPAARPAHLDLGWHRDVVEETNFHLSVVFADDVLPPSETCIKNVSRTAVTAEIVADATTENLELLVECMDQFAAVCEAQERGRRLFNGKRVSIYGVGILISIALIIRYEGLPGLFKPSADVLTLAVGAYTLWMTLGKSAALGETEEVTAFEVARRTNILMAFHGLAKVENNVEHTCWVPEIYREFSDEVVEGPMVDGSITKLEAAICLSIFEHFGNLLKWKGRRLHLDCYKVSGTGLGHIEAVERIRSINALECGGNAALADRLGAATADSARRFRPRILQYHWNPDRPGFSGRTSPGSFAEMP